MFFGIWVLIVVQSSQLIIGGFMKAKRKVGRPVIRPNRFTVSLSDEIYALLEDYSEITGFSKSELINNWLQDSIGRHRDNLEHIKLILEEESLAKG